MWPIVVLALALSACGGNMGSGTVPGPSQIRSETAPVYRNAIGESEIGTLNDWQRSLFSDPGWNAVPAPVERDESDDLPAPSTELLLELLQQQAVAGTDQAGFSRGTSALDPVPVGAYKPGDVDVNGIPSFGCNADPAMIDIYHIEDVIGSFPLDEQLLLQSPVGYVFQGIPTTNHFNKYAGFTSTPASISQALAQQDDQSQNIAISSIAYLAAQDFSVSPGEGSGPGGPNDCGLQAYSIRNAYWMSWNEKSFALPSGQTTALFNILPGPLGEAQSGLTNPITSTTAGQQPFLFGSWIEHYGTGYIVGIESANSGCQMFDDIANTDWRDRVIGGDQPYPNILHNPLYGILAERWQQSAIPDTDEWNSQLGWPVARPFAYNNGAQLLSADGPYYAFGQFFERGFIWWLDYDQQANPTTSDRAILYTFNGSNTFCDGTFTRSYPYLHYNNKPSAPLAADLLVDQYLTGNGNWRTVSPDQDGRLLRVPWTDEGAGQRSATVRALANPYGGVTVNGVDIGHPEWGKGLYRSCTWLWQDGTVTPAGTDYDPAQFDVLHTYLEDGTDIEAIRRIRAQVVDADGNIAYVDSLPLQIGDGSPGAAPSLSVLRADNGVYPSGYEALIDDLGEIGLPFSTRGWESGIEQQLADEGCQLAIWYDGGPGSLDELGNIQADWTSAERDSLTGLLELGIAVLLLSQDVADNPDLTPGNFWTERFGMQLLPGGQSGTGLQDTWGQVPGGRIADFGGGWLPSSAQHMSAASLASLEAICGAVERGSADDGTQPMLVSVDPALPVCGIGSTTNWPGASPTFTAGSFLSSTSTGPAQALLSWGSTAAPHFIDGNLPDPVISDGNARLWVYGLSWAASSPVGYQGSDRVPVARSRMLQNILRWLDNDSRYFDPLRPRGYSGEPEILSVTPYLIKSDGQITPGSSSHTGVDYPDPSGSDVLRSSPNLPDENHLVVSPEHDSDEDGINANDLDLQFPFYAYITWDDSKGQANGVIEPEEILDISYGGLLLKDDIDWQRANPNAGNYVQPSQLNIQRAVAGYYLSFTGDSGDELRATFGTAAPQLATTQSRPKLLVEAVAHWPADAAYGGQTPVLRWSMFPGHKVQSRNYITGTSWVDGYAGESPIPWGFFVGTNDIDPGMKNFGDADVLRLLGDFSHVGDGNGRSMLFDYATVLAFDGDLDDDNAAGTADKIPIRVRLITDYEAYGKYAAEGGTWPDQFPPADSFIEGGCYVSLAGRGNVCMVVMDNPEKFDPHDLITKVDHGEYVYDIDLHFIVDCAPGPLDVDLDWNYLGGLWGTSGNTQPVGTFPVEGELDETVSVDFTPAGGPGTYYFSLMVTNSINETAFYYWPVPVVIE